MFYFLVDLFALLLYSLKCKSTLRKKFMAYLIDFEGTDGCGKNTQAKLLLNALVEKNLTCVMQSFPCYDSLSSGAVRMYLDGSFGSDLNSLDAYQASSLYAVDRLCTMKLLEKENSNSIVILDRYMPSNMIHQASKIADPVERKAFLDWVDDFEYNKLKIPRPHLILFLDMPVEKSMAFANARKDLKSKTKKDIHESNQNHLKNAYKVGKEVAQKYGWTIVDCVDSFGQLKTIEQIHKNILEIVEGELNKLALK